MERNKCQYALAWTITKQLLLEALFGLLRPCLPSHLGTAPHGRNIDPTCCWSQLQLGAWALPHVASILDICILDLPGRAYNDRCGRGSDRIRSGTRTQGLRVGWTIAVDLAP